MTPRYVTAAASVVLFGALLAMLVVTANAGTAKNTVDLTAEEIYSRYLERTADIVYLVESRYTQTIDPFTKAVISEDRRDVGWDLRPSYPGERPIFITFPCICPSTDYPVNLTLMGMTKVDGRQLLHLFITDPQSESGPPTPETTVVWQDLYLDPRTFEPLEIVTHIDQYRDGSLGSRYTQLRTSVSRIFSRQLPDDPRIIR